MCGIQRKTQEDVLCSFSAKSVYYLWISRTQHNWDTSKSMPLDAYVDIFVPMCMCLEQWFSTLLMLRHFNIVSPSHTLISWLIHNCNLATVLNCAVNIFGDRKLSNESWPTGWEPLVWNAWISPYPNIMTPLVQRTNLCSYFWLWF